MAANFPQRNDDSANTQFHRMQPQLEKVLGVAKNPSNSQAGVTLNQRITYLTTQLFGERANALEIIDSFSHYKEDLSALVKTFKATPNISEQSIIQYCNSISHLIKQAP